jgi:hypothetical protein
MPNQQASPSLYFETFQRSALIFGAANDYAECNLKSEAAFSMLTFVDACVYPLSFSLLEKVSPALDVELHRGGKAFFWLIC